MDILSKTTLFSGWGRFFMLKLRLADGAVVERQLEDHGQAACVLPYDPERRTGLVARMPRPGPLFNGEDPYLIEACAGIIDPGEDAPAAARREALEELGVVLTVLEPVARIYTTPGVSSEVGHLFLAPYAAQARTGPGGGLAAENEEIEVLELPLAELARRARDGELRDLKTLALIQALQLKRPDLFG